MRLLWQEDLGEKPNRCDSRYWWKEQVLAIRGVLCVMVCFFLFLAIISVAGWTGWFIFHGNCMNIPVDFEVFQQTPNVCDSH